MCTINRAGVCKPGPFDNIVRTDEVATSSPQNTNITWQSNFLYARKAICFFVRNVCQHLFNKAGFPSAATRFRILIGSSRTEQSVQTLIDVRGNLLEWLLFFFHKQIIKTLFRERFTERQLLLKGQKTKQTGTTYGEPKNVLLCVKTNDTVEFG